MCEPESVIKVSPVNGKGSGHSSSNGFKKSNIGAMVKDSKVGFRVFSVFRQISRRKSP